MVGSGLGGDLAEVYSLQWQRPNRWVRVNHIAIKVRWDCAL